MILNYFKQVWEIINKIHPETRSLIIIILFGGILYFQITGETSRQMYEKTQLEIIYNKKAELYSMETAVEINSQVQLIAEKDNEAFDVLLLNYHNSTQSLQGYKYLYLSCLTEAPRSLDTPTLKLLWNKIDYIYYADELTKIHNLSYVYFEDIENISTSLPKLYRLIKASDAKAASFFTLEGYDSLIGLVILLYKNSKKHKKTTKSILPCILKLALLLDYNKNIKE